MAARDADPRIAQIAGVQHGLVTAAQLRAIGVSPASMSARAVDGRLHRIYRGVYAVGHRTLTEHARRRAALMALPGGALFSHRTAAALHGLLVNPLSAPLDLLVVAKCARNRPGLRIRATRQLPSQDRATAHGLPVTSVARTLVDISSTTDEPTVRRAFHEADVARTLDVLAINEVLTRLGNRPGAAILRGLIAAPPETSETFVEAYLGICTHFGVDRPSVDVHLDIGLPTLGQIDLVYEHAKVIIELDGAQTHMTRKRFEEGRRRDPYLSARGWLTLRFTWRRIHHDAAAVASEVTATLALRGSVHR